MLNLSNERIMDEHKRNPSACASVGSMVLVIAGVVGYLLINVAFNLQIFLRYYWKLRIDGCGPPKSAKYCQTTRSSPLHLSHQTDLRVLLLLTCIILPLNTSACSVRHLIFLGLLDARLLYTCARVMWDDNSIMDVF